jgi:hypothetical protein
MADYHAIGGVSATLQRLLVDRMEQSDATTPPVVTVGPPPWSPGDDKPHHEDRRVNLFLYRITEHGNLQNQQIPGRGDSSGYGHPPLSLNLHYLLTAYGNQQEGGSDSKIFDDTMAQVLLGSAMRVLHDVPIITDRIMTVRPASGRRILDQSLWNEFDQVKLSLEPLTLEDITKVWTALSLRYRLSAAYVVNVVQIESRRPSRFPRPVGRPISPTIPPLPTDPPSPGPMVYVPTIQAPTITDLRVRRAGTAEELPFPYANVGDSVVLRGTSLAGPVTRVAFGDLVVPATVAQGDRVEAVIPDDGFPGGDPIPAEQQLQPGVHLVRVIVSDPFVPKSDSPSNDVALMLVPYVNPVFNANAATSRELTITGTRLMGPRPGGEAVIGRSVVPRSSYRTSPAPPTPTTIVVPIPDTLPCAGVHVLLGDALAGTSVSLSGIATPAFDLTIDGVTNTVEPTTTDAIPVDELAPALQAWIRDTGAATAARPADPRFAQASVELWRPPAGGPRLVIVPGGLIVPIAVTASPLANLLGLTAPPPAGAQNAATSGELGSPPPLSSSAPRVIVDVGGAPATLALARPTSLASLASDLQAKLNAAPGGGPGFANARVLAMGKQLLVIPGAAADVTFAAAPGDDTTVAELQLQALFAVRVRVNGAESIDRPGASAVVRLPR